MLTHLDLRGQQGDLAEVLPRPHPAGAAVTEIVADIIEQVRRDGDEAVRSLTRKLDGVEVEELTLRSGAAADARARIPIDLDQALELAGRRIAAYHAFESGLEAAGGSRDGGAPALFEDAEGVTVRLMVRPMRRAGCYAPGGRARYPSTVLMSVVPARVAGVEHVSLCVPPTPEGSVDDATLAAAAIAGVDAVHPVGGAQAIAAMALGTESIQPVEVIAGPGNRYVAEAQRQLSGTVGIAAGFAGPSEVVVVAGPETPPELAALDLMVQAEHGPDGAAWLLTWDARVLKAVEGCLTEMVAASPRWRDLESTLSTAGFACLVDDASQAIAAANAVAPEHLELLVDEAESLLPMVEAAAAIFCGLWSPASMGDYVAGPNHILPTDRTARFGSALRADDFRRHLHAVSVSPQAMERLGPHVSTLARAEGLAAHAESVEERLRMLRMLRTPPSSAGDRS